MTSSKPMQYPLYTYRRILSHKGWHTKAFFFSITLNQLPISAHSQQRKSQICHPPKSRIFPNSSQQKLGFVDLSTYARCFFVLSIYDFNQFRRKEKKNEFEVRKKRQLTADSNTANVITARSEISDKLTYFGKYNNIFLYGLLVFFFCFFRTGYLFIFF